MEKKIIEHVLKTIQSILRFNNIRLSEEQIAFANERIVPYIEENMEIDEKKFSIFKSNDYLSLFGKQIYPVVVQYYAITQENTDLLEKLRKQKFNFFGGNHTLELYALDRTISSRFDEKDYLKLLEKHKNIVKRFYYSIRMKDEEKREGFIQDFADIIKADPTILEFGKRKKRDIFDFEEENSLLTRRNIEWFGKDFLIHSSRCQRNIINSFIYNLEPEMVEKLRAFMEKYPNYHPLIPINQQSLSFFTIDELGELSSKDANLYKLAFPEKLEYRIRGILEINPSFDCPDTFVREEIFRVLDDKTIAGLTPEGLYEISNIKIPKVKQAIVIPVRKINFAVFKDHRRVRKAEKQKEKELNSSKKRL